jgi:DNA-3-methyladenine glycosylase II
MVDLIKPDLRLRNAIEQIYLVDADFQKIEAVAGKLTVRSFAPTFASLVRIIVGQQLSTKAADAIFLRIDKLGEISPANIVACELEELRGVGLSQAKANCCQQLAVAIIEEKLSIESFAELTDREITDRLIQIKGIGKWTVEIFLLFCLERLDTLPAADLAIQVSYQKLKNLNIRPTAKELITLIEPFQPNRGAAAHLLWHYYRYLDRGKLTTNSNSLRLISSQ